MRLSQVLGFGLAFMPARVISTATTDSLQDVDPAGSGYLPNHNISPALLTGGNFGISWKNSYNTNEVFYAKTLVWTPPGAASEYIITVSNQNIIRLIDGLTGTLITSRTLDPPFQSVDTNCGDIPNTVGITGTPIIDSSTNIMYLFSKGYKGAVVGPAGTINGQYKFYAIQLPSLADVTGFPVSVEGHAANNDPTRYFVGGTVLQRPSLAEIGNVVVAGFGGHCDNFNYTGMLVAVSKTAGVGVTNVIAMEAAPGAPSPQPTDITVQGGGKAGIWQSGTGIAADPANDRIFFVTGNAVGPGANSVGIPANGKVPISTLEQAVANFNVNPSTGLLTQQDYFEPYEYDSLNGGDRDFGSSGSALLDPTTFSAGGVNRIIVAGGKSGKVYFLNADNLGGFSNGPGATDTVLQTIVNANSLLSGAGSYPLEGGYVYINPTSEVLYAYKFGTTSAGQPQFTLAGKSALVCTGKGVPTVTSLNGQTGTGIVWLHDVNNGLQAWNAVPVNGVLTPITLPATGRLQKYQRPVFGNSRVYVTETNKIYALGPAVLTPLTCKPSPIAFGSVTVGGTSSITVTCTANTAITLVNYCTTSRLIFQCQNSTLAQTKVASGATFTFPVVFNLTDAAIIQEQNAGQGEVLVGAAAAALTISATATTAGYANSVSVQVSGTVAAAGPYLEVNSTETDFGGIVLSGSSPSTSARSITLVNLGASTLTFKGFAWQDTKVTGMPFTNATAGPSSIVGNGFSSSNFPLVSSTLASGQSIVVPLLFSPTQAASYGSVLTFWSDGGYITILLAGSATGTAVSSSSSSSSSTVSSTSSSSSTSSTLSSSSSVSSSSSGTSTSITSSSSISLSTSSSGAASSSTVTSSSSTTVSLGTDTSSAAPSTTLSSSSSTSSSVSSSSSGAAPSTTSTSSTSLTTSSTVSSTSSSSSTSTGPSTNTATTTSSTLTTLSTVTTSSSSTATATSAYPYVGCYRDISTGHALPLLFSNTSTTPELCSAYVASLALKPTPTFLPYFYVEYHKECYGGSSFAWGSSAVTSLYGKNACTDVCSGSIGASVTGTAMCGGSKQFNLYATNTAASFSASITQSL